jgi:predicted PurR-regulated permease PerM
VNTRGDIPPLEPPGNATGADSVDEEPRSARVEIVVPIRTLLVIAGFAALAALAIAIRGLLFSVLVAGVVSLGLDPVVSVLVRRGWRRGQAAVCVFLSLLIVVVAIVVVTVSPLWSEIRAFADQLPSYWNQLASHSVLKPLLSRISERSADSHLSTLARELPAAASTMLGLAGRVFSSLLSVATLAFLSLFLLVERPRLTNWLFGFTRPATEERWKPVLDRSVSAVAHALLGNVLISVVAGVVAGLSALALGVPFPIVLGVIAGLLDLIPQLGTAIAGLILILAGLTISVTTAATMLVIQIIYQQVENNVLYPVFFRRVVSLSPLTTVVAAMVGVSLLGVVGAIVAVPLAALTKIVINEAARPRRQRMAELRRPIPDRDTEANSQPGC